MNTFIKGGSLCVSMPADAWIAGLISVGIVSLISLVGVVILWFRYDLVRKGIIYLVGFSAGTLLGGVFIHLLPEAVKEGFELTTSLYILLGLLFSFLIEKAVHWKHADKPHHTKPFATLILVGDGIHNFIDGLIIGGSYLASFPVGLATTLGVVFHEIPQEIGEFGVLIHAGLPKFKALLFNFLSALTAILGTLMALTFGGVGLQSFLVPFAAGNFIYIAGADLIPELDKEVGVEKSIWQFVSIVLGMIVMVLLLVVE